MKKINELINAIKEIDVCLDKYEYNNCSYEEYKSMISQGQHGNRCIRNLYLFGHHFWTSIMDNVFNECKQYTNKIYLYDKGKYLLLDEDKQKINKLAESVITIRHELKKDFDKYGIYPIEMEQILNNLITMHTILKSYAAL